MVETYNGWANYPTWAVHLWLTNDEQTMHTVTTFVQDYYRENLTTNADAYPAWSVEEIAALTRSHTADALGAWLEEHINTRTEMTGDATLRGMMVDLGSWAYGMVNWPEIVRALMGEEDCRCACANLR